MVAQVTFEYISIQREDHGHGKGEIGKVISVSLKGKEPTRQVDRQIQDVRMTF